MDLKPFATYAVRFHKSRFGMIRDHWEHHRALCLNGVICIDEEFYSAEMADFLKGLGLEVCFSRCTRQEGGNIDHNMSSLREAVKDMPGEWILTVDSDEYLPPHDFHKVALAARECAQDGQNWLHGWLCDRLSPGGMIGDEPPDYTYATLARLYPVMADVVKKVQGSANQKCFLSRKPEIGWLHHGKGDAHPAWFRLDHFKWFGPVVAETVEKLGSPWAFQYRRLVEHHQEHGRILGENILCSIWDHFPGWFDFWEVYVEASRHCKNIDKAVMVEVGVWQGRSAAFLVLYALAIGVKFRLWLVDEFRGLEKTSWHLPQLHPQFLMDSSFIALPVRNLFEAGLTDQVSFVQADSVRSARLFDDGSCDFVFIDGDHSYEQVKADLLSWLPKMKPGSLFAGHDYNHSTVARAVDEVFSERRIEVRRVGHSWLVTIP